MRKKPKCHDVIYYLKIAMKDAERTIKVQESIIKLLQGGSPIKICHSKVRTIGKPLNTATTATFVGGGGVMAASNK